MSTGARHPSDASARHPSGLPAHLAALDRTVVMGVLNVTPDSFSDGGRHLGADSAVAHGLELRDAGADIVDVGGESTRPGAGRVDLDEELRRVLPVVRELASAGVTVSIDTMRAAVASAALEAGAVIVNDVSGGLGDPDMAGVVAGSTSPYVVMHWRGHSADMASRATYDDVVADVVREVGDRVEALAAAGVDPARLVLDPGLGFAKDAGHSWALLGRLDAFAALGRPVLIGASRKGFLGSLLADPDGRPRPLDERDIATAALSAILAVEDVWGVRVHAVGPTVDALRVGGAVRSARVGA